MNNRRQILADLLKLASDIDLDVWNCLLLIKHICTETYWSTMEERNDEKILWDIIVQEAHSADGNILSAIKYAIEKWTQICRSLKIRLIACVLLKQTSTP